MKFLFKPFFKQFYFLGGLLTFMLASLVLVAGPLNAAPSEKSKKHIDPYEIEFIHRFLKPNQYLHVKDIKEGAEGFGLSVFHGTKVERFNVKVVGVMKQVINGRDSILVRISGDSLGDNNVVRGMSGSPIYIDNKIIGALSYGFDFSKEPIVGVTPITDMLDALIKPEDAHTLRITKANTNPLLLSSLNLQGTSKDLDKLRSSFLSSTTLSGGAPRMVPLLTPVALSGFSKNAKLLLNNKLKKFGLDVSSGTSGSVNEQLLKSSGAGADKLAPGSAVSLLLSTGDFTSVATGTVTGVYKNRILAFGHPLMEAGAVDIPMGSAYVHDILPSLSVSFKLSSPLKLLGHIYADRPWSVGGQIGKFSKLVPVSVTVIDGQRHFRKDYRSNVINHPDLTGDLISGIIMSAMDSSFQSALPYSIALKSKIKVKTGRVIERTDHFASFSSSSSGLSILGLQFYSDPVVNYVDSVVSAVYDNEFEKAEIESVNLEIKFEVGKESAEIKRVILENPVVEPGDRVKLTCILDPYNKPDFKESFTIDVPRDLPDGDYMIGVTGGASFKRLRKKMKLFDAPSKNLNQRLDKFLEQPNSRQLIALLALPDQAIHVDGKVIQGPPGHWPQLFFSNRYTNGPSVVTGEKRYSKQLNTYLTGSHVVGFTVKRKSPYMKMKTFYRSKGGGTKGTTGTYITPQARKVIGAQSKSSSKSSSSSSTSSSSTSSTKSSASSASNFAGSVTGLHTRSVKVWNQSTDSSLSGGRKKNCTVDSWGRLFPGFEQSEKLPIDTDVRAWSGLAQSGKFYFSTSNKVYTYDPALSGKQAIKQVASVDTTIIPAMAGDGQNKIFVAAVPEGQVYLLDGSGGSKPFFKTKENVITALACDPTGNLYIGVARSGNIYKVSAEGNLIAKIDSGQAHITCLTYSQNEGRLLVGTAESGNIYYLSSANKLEALYQTRAHIVTGAARDKKGNLFFTTAGPGNLIMVNKNGKAKSLATSDSFYHLYYDHSSDSIFTGDAEGDVTQIQIEPLPERAFFVPVRHTNEDAVVAIGGDDDSNLFVLTSNLPSIRLIKTRPSNQASFISKVRDAGKVSTWSRMRIYGAYNQFKPKVESYLNVETRTGNTLRPDSTWTNWQPVTKTGDGYDIASKPGRYFQYKVTWLAEKLSIGKDRVFPLGHDSVIGRIETTYLPKNNKPAVSTFNLVSGAFVSGEKKLKLSASDPDGDNLALSVEISSDSGKSWKMVKEDLRGKEKKPSKKKKKKKDDKKDKKSKKGKTEKSSEKSKDTKKKKTDAKKDSNSAKEKSAPKKKDDKAKDKSKDKDKKDVSAKGRIWLNRLHLKLSRVQLQNKGQDKKEKVKKKQEVKGTIISTGSSSKSKKSDKGKGKKADSKKSSSLSSITASSNGKIEWTWDTKKHKDGIYMLRFLLSDAPSNGGNNKTALVNKFYRTVVIDNKAPAVKNISMKFSGSTLNTISLLAEDKWSPIVNAVFKANTGQSWAFVPAPGSGLADRKRVQFQAENIKFKKKPKSIKVVVVDKAGNKFKKDVKVKK